MAVIDYIMIGFVIMHFISHTKNAAKIIQTCTSESEIACAFIGYFIHWVCMIYGFFFYIWR
jgi:hypothetical protein